MFGDWHWLSAVQKEPGSRPVLLLMEGAWVVWGEGVDVPLGEALVGLAAMVLEN